MTKDLLQEPSPPTALDARPISQCEGEKANTYTLPSFPDGYIECQMETLKHYENALYYREKAIDKKTGLQSHDAESLVKYLGKFVISSFFATEKKSSHQQNDGADLVKNMVHYTINNVVAPHKSDNEINEAIAHRQYCNNRYDVAPPYDLKSPLKDSINTYPSDGNLPKLLDCANILNTIDNPTGYSYFYDYNRQSYTEKDLNALSDCLVILSGTNANCGGEEVNLPA